MSPATYQDHVEELLQGVLLTIYDRRSGLLAPVQKGELTDAMGIPGRVISGLLRQLLAEGFITQTAAPRKGVAYLLTDKGEEWLADIVAMEDVA